MGQVLCCGYLLALGAVRPIIDDDATCHARGFEKHKKPGWKGLRKGSDPRAGPSGAYKDQGCVSLWGGLRYGTSFPCPGLGANIRSDRASGPHLPRAFPRDTSKYYDSAQLE